MGRVWVALDTAAPGRRFVALKTTLAGSDGGMNPDFWAVLADEAALASRINHPNVCATHELGHDGAVHFLVMDWSDGASLRDVLNALPTKCLGPELAAYVCACVAAGLHAAHELADDAGHLLGVVHRDVSPQNVLVSMRGQVRLADFGVAKSRGQLHKATETGEVKGKLSYMAPEQVTSKVVDRRADVFALGCVLYEATLGARPFHGADAMATMYKILEEEPTAPREHDPAFPEALERIVLKALAKDPERRYRTAEELREALMEYLSSTGRVFADKHVAEVVVEGLGPTLTLRNSSIHACAERLRRGEKATPLSSPLPERPSETLTPEGGVERTVTAMHQRRRALLTKLALGAVGSLGVLFTVWGLRSRASAHDESAARAPSALPAAAARSPAPFASPSGEDEVAAEAPDVALPPIASAEAARPVAARPIARVAPPAATISSRPTSKKPPRPIDRNNPFATP